MNDVIFISGIDTDAGKTFATGWIAHMLMSQGKKVATVKFIQTGCTEISEDIVVHRQLMGCSLPEDNEGLTAPLIFSYPASAQLAAKIDQRPIELEKIDNAVNDLKKKYDIILIEGAGGLMVPITDDFLTIDYPLSRRLPVILVTNGILGSINHTILSLEALKSRNMELLAIAYNEYFDKDEIIAADTKGFIKRYVQKHWGDIQWMDIPTLKLDSNNQ